MSDFVMGLSEVLLRDMAQIRAAAQNSANMNTPGYRSVRVAAMSSAFGDLQQSPTTSLQMLSLKDGSSSATTRPTDMAVSGNGWFALQTPDGVRLTRDGRFHMTESGELISKAGYPVLGENGPVAGLTAEFTVNRDGELLVGTQLIDRLLILQADPKSLQALGEGLYTGANMVRAPGDFTVTQGVLEQSNVDSSAEMIRIMEITRHFESVQRALSAYDQAIGAGISEIGKD